MVMKIILEVSANKPQINLVPFKMECSKKRVKFSHFTNSVATKSS